MRMGVDKTGAQVKTVCVHYGRISVGIARPVLICRNNPSVLDCHRTTVFHPVGENIYDSPVPDDGIGRLLPFCGIQKVLQSLRSHDILLSVYRIAKNGGHHLHLLQTISVHYTLWAVIRQGFNYFCFS